VHAGVEPQLVSLSLRFPELVHPVVQVIQEPRFNHQVAVTGGLLEGEAVALLQQFFQMLRDRS